MSSRPIENVFVAALNYRIDPTVFYQNVLEIKIPFLVIENKTLYTENYCTEAITGFEVHLTDEIFPAISVFPSEKSHDVTIICYGQNLSVVEKLIHEIFEETEILCQIYCPTLLSPFNVSPLMNKLNKEENLLFIEEGSGFASFSSEVLTQLTETGIKIRNIRRLCNNTTIPSSAHASTILSSVSSFKISSVSFPLAISALAFTSSIYSVFS